MITRRTLNNWRLDALRAIKLIRSTMPIGTEFTSERLELNERILRLTQELLDIEMLNKVEKHHRKED